MITRCPDALLIRLERLYGYRLAYCGKRDGESWLTLKPAPGCSVPIALWKVTEQDKKVLDQYEDVPQLYECMNFVIHSLPCFIYIMKPSYPECRPAASYVNCVEEGYREMGFDLVDLRSARY